MKRRQEKEAIPNTTIERAESEETMYIYFQVTH
jgi:hypothetical protein